jgi:hypothetical protein
MRRKTTEYFLMIVVLLGSVAAFGQNSESSALENPTLANARALLQAGRADIIREDLHMSDEESVRFWPVYENYHAQIMAVRDRQARVIADFLKMYRDGALSNDYAVTLINDYFDIKSDLLTVQKKFVRKFRKVLPALKVARFYQLESKMDAEIDAQLALFIPLADVG